MDSSSNVPIKIGNVVVNSSRKGTLVIQTIKCTKFIHDILYVPKFDYNLLTVDQLISYTYCLIFKNGSCRIYDVAHTKIASVNMKETSSPIFGIMLIKS